MDNFLSREKDPLTGMDPAERAGALMILGAFDLEPEQIADLTRLSLLCSRKNNQPMKSVLDSVIFHLQRGESPVALIQALQTILTGPPTQEKPVSKRAKVEPPPVPRRISRSRLRLR